MLSIYICYVPHFHFQMTLTFLQCLDDVISVEFQLLVVMFLTHQAKVKYLSKLKKKK